nr:unnamed protein product [Spirometra erinaceieuropaei]
MGQASNVGDTRKLYRLIRQVSGKPSTLSDSVRDVNGGIIALNSAKVERWREHFEHHLNFDNQPTSPLLSSSAEFLPSPTYAVPCDPPSDGEVADAIQKLRNNKAPGEDGILVPILKKGDKTRCENYRGISLIDVAAKIFPINLLRRFQAVRDSRTRPNQAGFRAGRGCADQIFTLRCILEFRHSYQQPTAVCSIDFAVAFDSIHRESLWRIMALDGVPAKIIAMIKAYYRSTTARVLGMTGGIIPGRIRIHQQAYMEAKTYVVKTLDRYVSLGELHRASLLGDPSLREVVDKLTESSRNWSFIIDRMVRRIRCTRSTFLISSHAVFRTMCQILNSAIPKCCYLEQSNLKLFKKYILLLALFWLLNVLDLSLVLTTPQSVIP